MMDDSLIFLSVAALYVLTGLCAPLLSVRTLAVMENGIFGLFTAPTEKVSRTHLLASAAVFGLVGLAICVLTADQTRRIIGLTFAAVTLTLTVIDLRHKLLPDFLTLPLLWAGLLLSVPRWGLITPEGAILGAAAGWLMLSLIRRLIYVIRGTVGLGGGDVKLVAAVGGWLGPFVLAPGLMVATVLAILFAVVKKVFFRKKNYNEEIPFGPFLVAGYLLMLAVYLLEPPLPTGLF